MPLVTVKAGVPEFQDAERVPAPAFRLPFRVAVAAALLESVWPEPSVNGEAAPATLKMALPATLISGEVEMVPMPLTARVPALIRVLPV